MFLSKTANDYNIVIPSSFNGYDIQKEISKGCFSVVFKVYQKSSNNYFAAKVISKKNIITKHDIRMVSNEINIFHLINHPNIVKLYDAFEIKNRGKEEFIVLIEEYCSNGTLLDFVINQNFKDENEKKKMMKELVSGINYLHKIGIAHCDIKLENILLDENNSIKISDFGLSKNIKGEHNEKKVDHYNMLHQNY